MLPYSLLQGFQLYFSITVNPVVLYPKSKIGAPKGTPVTFASELLRVQRLYFAANIRGNSA